jgi:hypothetical protein
MSRRRFLDGQLGKRTGRPRGSKSRSPWRRDALWVYRNLDNPDAKPPSAFAKLLLALAHEHPDRFFACLILLDAPAKAEERTSSPQDAQVNGVGRLAAGGLDDGRPPRLKTVTIRESRLLSSFSEETGMWVHKLPHDAHVVSCEADPAQREIRIFLYSESFAVAEEGQPIPELERERSDGPW